MSAFFISRAFAMILEPPVTSPVVLAGRSFIVRFAAGLPFSCFSLPS